MKTKDLAEKRRKHADYMRQWYLLHPGYNSANVRQWRKANPEKRRAQSKKYDDAHRIQQQINRLKREYGLSLEEVEGLQESQKGRCAICLRVVPLCVDHDHTTGQVRGLLCRPCNSGLGFFGDNQENLERALVYLRSCYTEKVR